MHQSRARFLLFFIIILVVFIGIFVYPKWIGIKILPWRLGLDLVGGTYLIYEIDMKNVGSTEMASTASGIRDVIERRVNYFGVSEPQITSAKIGDSYRLIVALAGVKDVKAAIEQIGLTPFLYFAEIEEATTTQAATTTPTLQLKPTALTGRFLKGAQLMFDNVTGQPQVSLNFNDEGAKIFEDLTARNIEKPLSVVLDNTEIQRAMVREKITGGKAQITGSFTVKEAKQLVERLNAGALPAPINLINQQTIGASLGYDSLQKALMAGLIGTIAVILFMLIYYGARGIVASLALIIYIILMAAVHKLFSITMSLSGIAGFLLSIGMAIDANILVFERVKEEIKKGVAKSAALEEGFRRAWPSIRDSNITTIISAIILYYLTSSFVRGFALTLLIGVIISMFSALTVTRIIFRAFLKTSGVNAAKSTKAIS